MISYFSSNVYVIVVAFLTLVFASFGLVLALDCVWRSKHQLREAMFFALLGFLPIIIRKICLFLGSSQATWYLNFTQIADVFSALFFFLAVREMYIIIRSLDNEK